MFVCAHKCLSVRAVFDSSVCGHVECLTCAVCRAWLLDCVSTVCECVRLMPMGLARHAHGDADDHSGHAHEVLCALRVG